jgi:hypothetical protein
MLKRRTVRVPLNDGLSTRTGGDILERSPVDKQGNTNGGPFQQAREEPRGKGHRHIQHERSRSLQ